MHFPTATTVLALVFLHTPSTLAQCEAPVPCQDPVLNALQSSDCQTYHAFLARGSDSGYPGHLGSLIRLVCETLTGNPHPDTDPDASDVSCGYENIVYPANSTYAGQEMWCLSAAKGANAGQLQMKEYAERCPQSKLILLGFSQGGSVALDVLGGGGGPAFECVQADNPAMDPETSPGSNIVAAAIFGAVRRTANQPYTVKGGKDYNGTDPRNGTQLDGLNAFADKGLLREWCNIGDPICAVGSSPVDVEQHLNYFKLYDQEAAQWLVRTATGNETVVVSVTSSRVPTKTPTGTKTGAARATATGRGGADGGADTQGNQVQDKEGGAGAVAAMGYIVVGIVGMVVALL